MTGRPAAGEARRFEELDVFRGLASLWVVYFHFFFRYRTYLDRPEKPLGWFSLPGLSEVDFGSLPVFWFFMISGFVIVWTLERSRTWRDFAVSRTSRLYPTYWAAAALTATLGLLAPIPTQHYSLGQILANLTMLQEIVGVPHLDGAYWSLTAELTFYLQAGLAAWLGLLPRLPWLVLGWMAACVFNQALPLLTGVDVPWLVQKFAGLRYGHFFGAGIVFYQLWRGRQSVVLLAALGLSALTILLAYPPVTAAICLGFFGLFWLAIRGRLRWIICRPLLWLGAISYSLYVSHQMLGYRVMLWAEAAGAPREAAVLLAAAVVLSVATALTALVERPALAAIRDWWAGRRGRVAAG